jgi:hypothetical protein
VAKEVLRDPVTLLLEQRITRRENDWRVEYKVTLPTETGGQG